MASTNKLYPPIIDGVLPAFYKSNSMVKISIPFSMNQMVGVAQVTSMFLRLKTVQTNDVKYCNYTTAIDFDNCIATFYLTNNDADAITVGLFYKAQLAYCGKTEGIPTISDAGYFSTVGIIKCVAKPTVKIANFDKGTINAANNRFLGVYEQDATAGDFNEKIYSYNFIITDENDNEYITSGEQLHNVNNDINNWSSEDEFITHKSFENGKIYYIQYTVTTVNNLVISSPRYRIMAVESIPMEKPIKVLPKLNFDEGYIEINFMGPKKLQLNNSNVTIEVTVEEQCSGLFLLSRGYMRDDYMVWDDIARFNLNNERPSQHIERDFTIEQGVTYKYRLQQYNLHGVYSEPIYSKEIYADFEDMFLYDGVRQLKVRFNPKVSSFKVDIPEQKLETIGSKYPFIFRNGNVYYHEFPISGLISYQLDEAKLFLNEDEIEDGKVLEKNNITQFGYQSIIQNQVRMNKDLISENLMSERYFKLKVLEWLTNGEIKLFRSPGEGNYLVRLLNTSMSPNDTLGRMLHTFTTTAYEIDDLNYNNLLKYNLISVADPSKSILQLSTIDFTPGEAGSSTLISFDDFDAPIFGFEIDGCTPGDQIIIKYADDQSEEIITIGITGSYNLSDNERPIESITFIPIDNNSQYLHQIIVEYIGSQQHYFDLITNIGSTTVVGRTYYGPQTNVINTVMGEIDNCQSVNINISHDTGAYKTKLLNMEMLRVSARPIIPLYRWRNEEDTDYIYSTTPFGVGYPLDELMIYTTSSNRTTPDKISEKYKTIGNIAIYAVYTYTGDIIPPVIAHLINLDNEIDINADIEPNPPVYQDKLFYEMYPDWEFAHYYDYYNNYAHTSEPDMRFAITQSDNTALDYIDIKNQETVVFTNLGSIDTLYLGNGVIAETVMRLQVVDYSLEDSDPDVFEKKQAYLNAKNQIVNELNTYLATGALVMEQYQQYLAAVDKYANAQIAKEKLTAAINALRMMLTDPTIVITEAKTQVEKVIAALNNYITSFYNNFNDADKPVGTIMPPQLELITEQEQTNYLNGLDSSINDDMINTTILDLVDIFNEKYQEIYTAYIEALNNYNLNIPVINNFENILPADVTWGENSEIARNTVRYILETNLQSNLNNMYNSLHKINKNNPFEDMDFHSSNLLDENEPANWAVIAGDTVLGQQDDICGLTSISYESIFEGDNALLYDTNSEILVLHQQYLTAQNALSEKEQATLDADNAYKAARVNYIELYNQNLKEFYDGIALCQADIANQQTTIITAQQLIDGLEAEENNEQNEATINFLKATQESARAKIVADENQINTYQNIIDTYENDADGDFQTALADMTKAQEELEAAQQDEAECNNQIIAYSSERDNLIAVWNDNLSWVKTYIYVLENIKELWDINIDNVTIQIKNYTDTYNGLQVIHNNLSLLARNYINELQQIALAYQELLTKEEEWQDLLDELNLLVEPEPMNKPEEFNLQFLVNKAQQAWYNFIVALRNSYANIEKRYAK